MTEVVVKEIRRVEEEDGKIGKMRVKEREWKERRKEEGKEKKGLGSRYWPECW